MADVNREREPCMYICVSGELCESKKVPERQDDDVV